MKLKRDFQIHHVVEHILWKFTTRRFYLQLVGRMILVISAASLVLGVVLIHLMVDGERKRARAESMAAVSLTASNLEELFSGIETQSFLLAQNASVLKSLQSGSLMQDVELSMQVFNEIALCKNNNDRIEEAVLYAEKMGGICSNQYGFITRPDHPLFADMLSARQTGRAAGWLMLTRPEGGKETVFYRRLPMMKSGEDGGMLLLYVKRRSIENQMPRGSGYEAGAAYVLDADGNLIFRQADGTPFSIQALEEFQHIKEPAEESGFFETRLDGIPVYMAVCQGTSGKSYVSILEQAMVNRRVYGVLFASLALIITTILVGILFSIRYSRQIYSPVEALVKRGTDLGLTHGKEGGELSYIRECFDYLCRESEEMSQYVRTMRVKLRGDLLLRLLENPEIYGERFLEECESYDISPERSYAALMFTVADPDSPGLREALDTLLRDTAMQAGETADVLRRGRETAVVMSFPPEVPSGQVRQRCRGYVQRVLRRTNELPNNAAVYASIGGCGISLGELSASCRTVLMNAQEHSAACETRSCTETPDSGCEAPVSTGYIHSGVQPIAGFLQKGKLEDAAAELDRLISMIDGLSPDKQILLPFKILLSELIFLTNRRDKALAARILEQDIFYSLDKCRTTGEIRDWFIQTLFPMMTGRIPSCGQQKIVPQVCDYIRTHVCGDITLADCAEQVHLSPAYLSRLFKKELGVSFLDYVMTSKIDEVKKLLVDTSLSVSEIAQQVGYSPRNLYRVFYKATLMSPNEFRQMRVH